MATDKAKIRDLETPYNELIIQLVRNGKEVFELQYSNSERAVVRSKSAMREFKKSVDAFYNILEGVRRDVVDSR